MEFNALQKKIHTGVVQKNVNNNGRKSRDNDSPKICYLRKSILQ